MIAHIVMESSLLSQRDYCSKKDKTEVVRKFGDVYKYKQILKKSRSEGGHNIHKIYNL